MTVTQLIGRGGVVADIRVLRENRKGREMCIREREGERERNQISN